MTYKEPLVVIGINGSSFHRFPGNQTAIIPFLLKEFGSEVVTIDNGSNVKLADWYKNKSGFYLKDWKINDVAEMQRRPRVFKTPPFFKDWLNEYYLHTRRDKLDFQFLYWGDAGTATGYHEDVAGTFSWSFNLRGRKVWQFFNRPSSPHLPLEFITCVQLPGEMVFVPSGCYHTVKNLENDTISINQNWLNEFNLLEVAQRIVLDSLEANRRLRMFDIRFESPSEEWQKIEFITKSNNDINMEIFLDIIQFQIFERNPNDQINSVITEALREICKAPQLPHFQIIIEQLVRNINR
jgi:hypothetical protein